MDFNHFLAVDWSGAKSPKHTKAIAVAQTSAGTDELILCKPSASKNRNWSRDTFLESLTQWIEALDNQGQKALMGIDCNLSIVRTHYKNILKTGKCAMDLWSYVDQCCEHEENLFASSIWERSMLSHLFWTKGKATTKRTSHPDKNRRQTEIVCRKLGFGSPEDPLKLIGAKQVGKGGLSGMRLLHALKKKFPRKVAIWPFEKSKSYKVATLVIVEIYPRLFLNLLGYPRKKVTSPKDLSRLLESLGVERVLISGLQKRINASDHDTDAIIAAAGMKVTVQEDPMIFEPKELDPETAITEGWILGVSKRTRSHFDRHTRL